MRCVTNQEIIERFETLNPSLRIVGDIPSKRDDIVQIHCNVCNQDFTRKKYGILTNRKNGCPVCLNKIIIKGFNDVATTDDWVVPYFADKNDAYTHSRGNVERLKMKCPLCGKTRYTDISSIIRYGRFLCHYCGDGVSFPNKLGRQILLQLNVDNLITEYSPKWISPKRFDCYFEHDDCKYVLEMDGGFHYMDNTYNGESLETAKDTDFRKELTAKFHGIEVIRIDCRSLNAQGIRKEVEKSRLAELFDLSVIDWDVCTQNATNPMIYTIAQQYKAKEKINNIARNHGIARVTVRRYLKIASDIGLIRYTASIGKKNTSKRIMIFKNDKYITTQESYSECCRFLNDYDKSNSFNTCSIRNHFLNNTSYKGYLFKERIS